MNTTKDQLNSKVKTYSRSIICLLLVILLAIILPEYLARADGPTPGTVGYLASTPTPSSLKSLSTASSLASATSPLNKFNTWNLNGGYVAAGVGMRNRGYGTINISLPSGSSVVAAYLYWDILGITADPLFAQGQFNGKAISGTLIGQGPDPCWGNSANFAYRADVTSSVTGSGAYALSGFRSGTTNGNDPWVSGSASPMLEGASLVVIYQNPNSPATQVQLYDGGFETQGATATLMIDGFTAPNPMVKAQTTFIGADGQTNGGDLTTFNGTQFPNIWNGADPQAGAQFQYGNLWDTMTRDVTSLVTSGSTSATASIQGTGDCLVWVAQAFSIQQSQSNPTNTPPITIQITDLVGNPVNALALNSDGWPTPNPLTVRVTLNCLNNLGGFDCVGPFAVVLDTTTGTGRFYINQAQSCSGNNGPGTQDTYPTYTSSCDTQRLYPGQTVSYTWQVWIQPSEAAQFRVTAIYGLNSATNIISIPKAAIHPVVLVGGFGAFSPAASDVMYDPLIKTLKQMGYEKDKTLFTWGYGLESSFVDNAVELANKMKGWHTNALTVPWVHRTDNGTSFDIMGHSGGALLTRVYMQLTPNTDYTPLNKLLLVGGPNKGILSSYPGREGLQGDGPIYWSYLEGVLRAKSFLCGNFTIFHLQKFPFYKLDVTNDDRYKTLHERRCGILSLPEMLPVVGAGIPAYLVDNQGLTYPYPISSGSPNGYQYNPLLEGPPSDLAVYPQKDPWWLPTNPTPNTTYYNLNGLLLADLARRNIDVSNVHVFYNDNLETPETYTVTTPSALLWRNGVWSGQKIDGTYTETIMGRGDDAVPAYSAIAADLWPGSTPHRLLFLEPNTGQDTRPEKHVNLPVYPEAQQEIGLTLAGIRPPFSNPLSPLNESFQKEGARIINGYGLSPIEIIVTDSLGRRLGYDPTTGQILQEIPMGIYNHPEGKPVEFVIYDPVAGDYTLTVTGIGTGPYTLLDIFTDEHASVPILFEQSTTQLGQSYVTTMTVPVSSGDVPHPPEVSAGDDFSVTVGTPATFNGVIKDINPNDTFEIQWEFGDGSKAQGTLAPLHTYTVLGIYTSTLTVTDSVGFVVSDTVHVTVAYPFTGFLRPIENLPTLNTSKAGSAVPIKFSLDRYWGLNIFATGYPASKSVACGSIATDATEATLAPGSSGLSYDSTSGQYIYVWKTDKAWANTCRTLVVKLNDNSYHYVNFKFK